MDKENHLIAVEWENQVVLVILRENSVSMSLDTQVELASVVESLDIQAD